MRVRDATAADIPSLVAFVIAEAHEAQDLHVDAGVVTKAVTAAFDDRSRARYWMLEDGGTVLGAIAIVREWSDWRNGFYWWIQFVFLVPSARGRGHVDALVEHVRRVAGASAAVELRLYVHGDNTRAIRAYERIGFARTAYQIMTLPVPASSTSREYDDDALWIAFHERTLLAPEWTHVAHLRVAWLHLARYPLDEAHLLMRIGIIRLNASHGLVETPERGYHETLTRAWLALVAAARHIDPCSDSRGFVAKHELPRDAPLRHYSRERLFSLHARTVFVPPDLAPFTSAASK